jgi:hypothetical protein
MTFKSGDRVRYFGPYPQGDKADFGTIVSRVSDRVGTWWVDWDNGECLHVQDIHIELINTEQSEISASISLNKLSVKQLKDLLNKMDDSIQLSFTDLKIHFG